MNLDLSEYMGAYIDGSRENLDTMDRMLLSLEQNPANIEAVEEIFRAAHTLKGMSATMGFEKIAHLTHEMENILDKLRSHKMEVSPAVIDLIFETFDVLRTLVNDSIESTDSNIDLSELSAKLSSMASGGGATAAHAPTASTAASATRKPSEKSTPAVDISDMGMSEFELSSLEEAGDDGRHVLLIQVSLVADCLLKGPRIFMVLRTLDDLQCDIVKSNPDVKDLENEKFDRSFKMVVITDKQPEQLRDGIESISEIETVEVTDITGGSTGAAPSAPPAAPQPVPSPPKPAPQVQAPAASAPPQAPRAQPAAPQPTSNAATQVAEYHQSQAQQAQANTQNSSAAPGEQSQETEEEEKVKEVIELVQLVTFTMAGETYALEIKQVEAIINLVPITRVPKAPMHIDGVINLRGEIVPVINTRRRLRLAELERKPSNQIIILSFEEEKVKAGFLVDSVQEVIRLPETAIEPPSRVSESVDVEYLRGVGKIDNKIIILLNASRIVFGKMAESAV
ncbi:MAG: chemotaxis protein CheW [Candidatus Riflebacteria bacterium]|nr:chemotaxis protein CheW [Candidatus Riflebacteria bacterium]